MSNDVVVGGFGGAMVTPESFNPGALAMSAGKVASGGGKAYLIFKDGVWTYGADREEADPEGLWAVNPLSFQFGYMEWADNEPGSEVMVPAGQHYSIDDLDLKFDPNKVKDHRVAPQASCELKCISGDDIDVEAVFKSSTNGGVNAISKLAQAIAAHAATSPDDPVPVVALDSDDYMHKKYGRKTYVPVMDVEKFIGWSDVPETEEAEAEAAPEEAPAPARRKSTPKEVTEEVAPAPRARRRRRK